MDDLGEDWPYDVTTISAPDGSITAKFVSFGATLTELWVKDKNGEAIDVVPGYDDNTMLMKDPGHPVFNAIVGRYANRLSNGTFSVPISGDSSTVMGSDVYHIATNDGKNTLHGGLYGWDRRSWTIIAKTDTSVTYYHLDKGDEGFPGNVFAYVTHSVASGELKTEILAQATEKTPIMLTQHIYWNLDAWRTDAGDGIGANILDHTLRINGSRVLEVTPNGLPTGAITDVEASPFDFRTAIKIGARWDETMNLGGPGKPGYNHCWIHDEKEDESALDVSLWSRSSGIRLDIISDSPATQCYTGNYLNTPRKTVHGGPKFKYSPYSAVAIELQGWVDAINHPEWGVDQFYEPGKDFKWSTTYKFSVLEGGSDDD